jgi:hypothetical protein
MAGVGTSPPAGVGCAAPHRRRSMKRTGVGLAMALGQSASVAMGGHFDVDDASVLAPGRCQVEGWLLRGHPSHLWHVGPSCRFGEAEFGATVDRQTGNAPGASLVGVQVKWVTDAWASSAIGVAVAVARDAVADRSLLSGYVPVSWPATGPVQLHANVGVDRRSDGHRTSRAGVAAEGEVSERLTLLAERFRIAGENAYRFGLRWAIGADASIDVTAASVRGRDRPLWGLGFTYEFAR